MISTICFTFEFSDLRGIVDYNDEVQLFYRKQVYYQYSYWESQYENLYKLNISNLNETTILESYSSSNWNQGWSHSDIFYDYVINDNMGLTTINCGKKYSYTNYDSTFIRINSNNLAIWENYWSVLNIKCSNINSTTLYATYKAGISDFRLIKSNDCGLTWSSIENAPNYLLRGVSPFYDQLLFYASSIGELYRSEDGTTSSTLVNNSPQLNWSEFRLNYYWSGHLNFLFDQNEQHIYAIVKDFIGNQYHFVRSDDNGFNWDIISSENSSIFIDLDITNSGLIFKSVGSNIFKSTDYGDTFTLFQNIPENITGLYQVDNSENLYAITDFILYEVTIDSIIPLIDYTSINQYLIPENSIKLNNHPNPFNPTTTISFSIPEEGNIDLAIYNIKGQMIKSLLNDQIVAGEHSVIWNGKDTSGKKVGSGVYLYKLNVNGKTEAVKKCLLLK